MEASACCGASTLALPARLLPPAAAADARMLCMSTVGVLQGLGSRKAKTKNLAVADVA